MHCEGCIYGMHGLTAQSINAAALDPAGPNVPGGGAAMRLPGLMGPPNGVPWQPGVPLPPPGMPMPPGFPAGMPTAMPPRGLGRPPMVYAVRTSIPTAVPRHAGESP